MRLTDIHTYQTRIARIDNVNVEMIWDRRNKHEASHQARYEENLQYEG